MYSTRREDLGAIFKAGLDRVDPYRMLIDHVTFDGETMTVTVDESLHSINLDNFTKVVVIGAGKATAPMALALEKILGDRLDGGLIVVKYGHVEKLERIETVEADHPVPDENGRNSTKRLLNLIGSATADDLILCLISGGGSAREAGPGATADGALPPAPAAPDHGGVWPDGLAAGGDGAQGPAPDGQPSPGIWQPKPGTSWHWQLTGSVDENVSAMAT